MLLLRKLLNKIVNGSLDVDSLFTDIPLEETIDLCPNTLLKNTEKVEGLSKIEFKELLPVVANESYFNFNGKLCEQVDGVTMVLPLGATAWGYTGSPDGNEMILIGYSSSCYPLIGWFSSNLAFTYY